MKLRKPIFVTIILALVAAMMLFAVACGGEDDNAAKTYTMRFETYGGTEIDPITAVGGSMIFVPSDPEKSGSTFAGWYTNSDFGGEAVQIPNIMPDKNVTYYAKFDTPKTEYTLIYEYNKGQVPHAANIANVTVEAGESVTVADGKDYGAEGYMFMGWSIYPHGLVADVKQDGQYNVGDVITLTDSNVKLYAQWAVEYTDARKENNDKIYVYEPLIDKGKGAAKLIRADEQKQDLDGFVKSGSETTSGSTEFTFYADEFENGEFTGRLYADRTYATADGKQGKYVRFDYVWRENYYDYTLALDGFGYAVITQKVGDQLSVYASGDYEYNPATGDYLFKYNTPKDDDAAKPQTSYFNVLRQDVEDTEFDGYFLTLGAENIDYEGETYDYYNIDGYNWSLYLNGYGSAKLTVYNDDNTVDMTVKGDYYGTDFYESSRGEWQFVSESNVDENGKLEFKFIIGVVPGSNGGYYPVFAMCDETVFGMYYSTEENDKSTLYIDGYGMAQYRSNGVVYEGDCTVEDGGIVTLVCTEERNDSTVETERMIFVISTVGTKKVFSVSKDGFIINADHVLTSYNGTATVVEIPDGVVEIAADAFNYVNTNVSLTSVTVPASVDKIGARAFQNYYKLRRAIFLGTTPAELDYTGVENDPFRWGKTGSFIIVVPDEAVDAYKTAWPDFASKIMGATEASKLPEFEIDSDGVLIRYNKPEDLEEGTLLDIIIPDGVTEIADYVFQGMDFIKSVDLNNVIEVGDNAFYGCVNLETVNMPNVQSLGEMAFAACEKLNNSDKTQADVLKLPAIKTIGESAFSACASLRLVQLGEDIAEIGDFAFYECNVYEADPPLFVELMGETAPMMGSKITVGNIAFRFKVQDIKVALNCYKNSTWSSYATNLYIESGEEKGMYMSGDVTLELDGRAVYQGSYVLMYAIDGEDITFYEYNSSSTAATPYTAIKGKYKNGIISVAFSSTTLHFAPIPESKRFTTKDGNYTLECDPMDLLPESYEDNKGYADVKFNGKDVKLYISGYRTKIIYNYEDVDGKLYDITIDFNGDVLDITKKLSDIRYTDIKAPDGSKITILIKGSGLVYIEKANFEIVVDEATGQKLYWEASVVFAQRNGNVFTFSFTFRNTVYNFTVTVSDDYKTFTYDHTKN